ncbi:MAG TPA: cytochrome c biogenesis protein ResB, partial [Gemmataceae bacterium]|nr:cytochrome c biogenesis protein ResB [Gemmataceae bacterium]
MSTDTNGHDTYKTDAPTRRPANPVVRVLVAVLKALASLRLTLVLFVFALALVFFGTVAQMDYGIWTVVDKYFWSWGVKVPLDLIHKFGTVFFDLPKNAPPWSGWFPFPAGKLLGLLMLVNLLAAHALRFKISWKRSGIILIHSGLILLFVGEFITREFAIEQRMTIPEGKTVYFTEDTRHVELSFVDKSGATEDRVTVVPQNVLKAGGFITHGDLPCNIEVVEYQVNSRLSAAGKTAHTNPATHGVGLGAVAVAVGEVSGVDPNQTIDMPAAYLKLSNKSGTTIGTYLVSLELYRRGMIDEVEIGGKKYEVALRFKRHYKPFGVHLIDFKFDRYPGTQKPKNYSSDVKVFDDNGQLLREQTIRMNDPLRFAGETFYQSSFENEGTAVESTVLQVVKNPGWLIPYISCVMVGLGLILHFGLALGRFLNRRTLAAPSVGDGPPPSQYGPGLVQKGFEGAATAATQPLGLFWRLLTPRNARWVALGIVGLYLLGVYGRMKPRGEYDYNSLAQVPVLDGGRVKPLDSVARVYLRFISGKSVFEDEKGKERPAIQWYMDTLSADTSFRESDPAWNYKVVRIDNEQVLAELKLDVREGLRYSMNELRKHLKTLIDKHQQATAKKMRKQPLDQTESKYLEVYDRLSLMQYVARGRGHDNDSNKLHLLPPRAAGENWESLGLFREDAEAAAYAAAVEAARKKLRENPGGLTAADQLDMLGRMVGGDPRKMKPDMVARLVDVFFTSDPRDHMPDRREELLASLTEELPPADRDAVRSFQEQTRAEKLATNPAAAGWEALIAAYRAKKPAEFNEKVGTFLADRRASLSGDEISATKLELSYNRFSPFLHCVGLYVFALLLGMIGFVLRAAELPQWGEGLRRAGTAVLLATLCIHTASLFVRMSLMDRPLVFVTNLYSSAVFIGWGCVALGLLLERLYPIGIGNVLAAVLGLSTTIVAHNLATDDTLEMMQAVLDTNFWLATHVTTVTLGYTATFVAGFVGAMYVFLMLAAVVRQSFEEQRAEVPHLLAFGAAVAGLVAIPLMVAWPIVNALAKFEIVHSSIPDLLFYGIAVAGGAYAFALFVNRAGLDGSGPKGENGKFPVPKIARPIAAMGLTTGVSRVMAQMCYGVLCFATMLSFIGTVLGGIWADQS